MQEHKKHADLKRPVMGYFHANEWAILGTDCAYIRALAVKILAEKPKEKIQYIDADHQLGYEGTYCTSEKHIRQANYPEAEDKFSIITRFREASAVLINGNHYQGNRQIVVIDAKKETSLKKRLNQCSNVDLIILRGEIKEPFNFFKDHVHGQSILVLHESDESAIIRKISSLLSNYKVVLKALILAGGESKRMGKDKSKLDYFGKAHELHLAELCQSMGLETYLSKKDKTEAPFPVIADRFLGLGPAGAICSAFMQEPDTAWLVLACDLPLIDKSLIQRLINKRNPVKYATAVRSTEKEFPEPLIAVYEPRAYQRLLSFVSLGFSCPRKFLINSDIETLEITETEKLTNVNTPEEFEEVVNKLRQ